MFIFFNYIFLEFLQIFWMIQKGIFSIFFMGFMSCCDALGKKKHSHMVDVYWYTVYGVSERIISILIGGEQFQNMKNPIN